MFPKKQILVVEDNPLNREILIEILAEHYLVLEAENGQEALEVLKELLPRLEPQEDYSNDALYQLLTDYVAEQGCKNGYVMWPVRTAVSGKQMTPAGATEIM